MDFSIDAQESWSYLPFPLVTFGVIGSAYLNVAEVADNSS